MNAIHIFTGTLYWKFKYNVYLNFQFSILTWQCNYDIIVIFSRYTSNPDAIVTI